MATIKIKRNDTWTKSLRVRNKSDGSAVDTTGWIIWFTVRDSVPLTATSDDNDAIISKEILGNDTGISTLTLTSEDTNIDPKEYIFDVQYKDSSDEIHSSETDKFIIEADITRST